MDSVEITTCSMQSESDTDLTNSSQMQCTLLPANEEIRSYKDDSMKKLLENLYTQSNMIIDFSSLKTCINPTSIGDEESIEEFDYKALICDLVEKQSEKLPNLEKLAIRRFPEDVTKLTDDQLDQYNQLHHGIMQMLCLTELDFNNLPVTFHSQLEFWNLHNLEKLSITNSKLKTFPGSVGRLRKLRELDLSGNALSTLPLTLAFCNDLELLDLHHNKFRQLPGVILSFKNLKTLRRLDNPLTPRYECHGPTYTRKISNSQPKSAVFQPTSLQEMCTAVTFASQIDYWKIGCIGPLQCKTLDRLASKFLVCGNCKRIFFDEAPALMLEVLLIEYVELSGVPFLFYACSESCQNQLSDKYGEMNIQLQKDMDRRYEETMKLAQEMIKEGKGPDLGPAPPISSEAQVHNNQVYHINRRSRQRRRLRKMCSIM